MKWVDDYFMIVLLERFGRLYQGGHRGIAPALCSCVFFDNSALPINRDRQFDGLFVQKAAHMMTAFVTERL